jgi:hypothetical protein
MSTALHAVCDTHAYTHTHTHTHTHTIPRRSAVPPQSARTLVAGSVHIAPLTCTRPTFTRSMQDRLDATPALARACVWGVCAQTHSGRARAAAAACAYSAGGGGGRVGGRGRALPRSPPTFASHCPAAARAPPARGSGCVAAVLLPCVCGRGATGGAGGLRARCCCCCCAFAAAVDDPRCCWLCWPPSTPDVRLMLEAIYRCVWGNYETCNGPCLSRLSQHKLRSDHRAAGQTLADSWCGCAPLTRRQPTWHTS